MADQFINEPQEGTVIVHDVFGNTKEVPIKNLKFRISVYGILVENGKFLVHHDPGVDRYAIPGGAIELGEHIKEALEREFREETGLLVKAVRLVDTREDFFFHENITVHSILIFYEVEKIGGKLLTKSNAHDSDKVEFLSFEKLKQKGLLKLQLEVLVKAR